MASRQSLLPALEFLQTAQTIGSLSELDCAFAKVLEPFGFEVFQYTHLATPGQPLLPRSLFGRPSEAWNAQYRQGALYHRDPALKAIFTQVRPFTWTDIRQGGATAGALRIFDEAGDFDLKEGVVVPVHGPHGAVAGLQMVGANCDLDPAVRPTLHTLGLMYAALGLPLSELSAEPKPRRGFSAREKECLLWSARGKSDWDIGMILGLAERTVSMHCDRARARVGAHTRIQALATALKLGWITAEEI